MAVVASTARPSRPTIRPLDQHGGTKQQAEDSDEDILLTIFHEHNPDEVNHRGLSRPYFVEEFKGVIIPDKVAYARVDHCVVGSALEGMSYRICSNLGSGHTLHTGVLPRQKSCRIAYQGAGWGRNILCPAQLYFHRS